MFTPAFPVRSSDLHLLNRSRGASESGLGVTQPYGRIQSPLMFQARPRSAQSLPPPPAHSHPRPNMAPPSRHASFGQFPTQGKFRPIGRFRPTGGRRCSGARGPAAPPPRRQWRCADAMLSCWHHGEGRTALEVLVVGLKHWLALRFSTRRWHPALAPAVSDTLKPQTLPAKIEPLYLTLAAAAAVPDSICGRTQSPRAHSAGQPGVNAHQHFWPRKGSPRMPQGRPTQARHVRAQSSARQRWRYAWTTDPRVAKVP